MLPFDPAFKQLVDHRKEQNFSVVQLQFLGPVPGWRFVVSPSILSDMSSHTFNLAYWQDVDRYISYANDNGILPVIGFAAHVGMDQAPLESWKFLWSYVIARYGANAVSWFICQEYNMPGFPDRTAKVLSLGRFIKAADPYKRAISVHPCYYAIDGHEAWTEPWYDFIMLQGGHNASFNVVPPASYGNAYALKPPKPVLEAECDYEGIYGGSPREILPSQVRRGAYYACS